jgi:hypothetical protein
MTHPVAAIRSNDSAPLFVGVKATSKTRRAFRAALTPPATRTTGVVAAPRMMADMAHQE